MNTKYPVNQDQIKELILHREPFLFAYEITSSNEELIAGSVQFKGDNPIFKGHFPNQPIVPGVILIEAMAQLGGAGLLCNRPILKGSLYALAQVKNANFKHPVLPNSIIRAEIKNLRISTLAIIQEGTLFNQNNDIIVQATWTCMKMGK